MRGIALSETGAVVGIRLQSTAAPAPVARCEPHTCPWWPYSDSKDFRTNAALILIVVFSLLVCIMAFVGATRYIQRRRRCTHEAQLAQAQEAERVVVVAAASAPKGTEYTGNPVDDLGAGVQVYAKKGAGEEAECAICLSEFIEGEVIKVLGKCNHVFHVQCIQQWLNSQPSCPNCRSNCLQLSPPMLQSSS